MNLIVIQHNVWVNSVTTCITAASHVQHVVASQVHTNFREFKAIGVLRFLFALKVFLVKDMWPA